MKTVYHRCDEMREVDPIALSISLGYVTEFGEERPGWLSVSLEGTPLHGADGLDAGMYCPVNYCPWCGEYVGAPRF